MEKSNIYTKLLEFQKLGISLKKDSKGAFRNGYASMNEVLDKVVNPLNELGLIVVQAPQLDSLYTRIIHPESETWIESSVPFVSPTDMQKLGGAITYARRYALVSMLALEAEDDDGETAVGRTPSTKSATVADDELDSFKI